MSARRVERMNYDLLIKDGKLVTSHSVIDCTIGIDAGKVSALHRSSLGVQGEKEVDAKGMIVLPGLIDPHVHFSLPISAELRSSDSFESGSKAAAFGGITTFLDFTTPIPGKNLQEQLKARVVEARQASVDFSFHIVINDASSTTLEDMGLLVQEGFSSFKVFLTYSSRGLMLNDANLIQVLTRVKELRAIVLAHCENDAIVEDNQKRLRDQGKVTPEFHAEAREAFAEAEAIGRASTLAKHIGTRLYIVHVSSQIGLREVAKTKASGFQIIAETCPHYLSLSKQNLKGSKGHLYLMTPPLRSNSDPPSLWNGIVDGHIDTIGTDHCPFYQKDKNIGSERFYEAPMGIMGVETLLPIIYTDGVLSGRISLSHLVKICSENPAKSFDLYPRKGSLSVGSDADLVIIDPHLEKTVEAESLHMNVDYNIYQGRRLLGWPAKVISRGEIVVENDCFVGKSGRGQLLRRNIENSQYH